MLPISERSSPKALSMCGLRVCMYVRVHVDMRVYVRVTKGGLKACICLHVSVMRV